MNKTAIAIISVLATVIITVGGLAGFGAYLESRETPTKITPTQTSPNLLTQEEYDAFLGGCNEDGESFQFCNCAIEYLEDYYGRDKILDWASKMNTSDFWPVEFDEAIDYCTMVYEEA